ncbi:MAG: hypothetical protein KDC45_08395 [Bacteroidetes bacterium]|nr:hypothetical protein [Bacteroidota bacterium]
MRFNKKFILGLLLEFGGMLTALYYIGDYRTMPIVYFWLGMLAGLSGIFLLFKGIESRRTP